MIKVKDLTEEHVKAYLQDDNYVPLYDKDKNVVAFEEVKDVHDEWREKEEFETQHRLIDNEPRGLGE
jgi:hypothetical protein